MKKISILFLLSLTVMLSGCGRDTECRVHGVMPNDSYEGKYIYMIALDKSIRDSVGVDSCMVKDRKFEMTTRKNMMAIIRMDWHFRYGLQDLLVVEEPGDIYVTIDSVSSVKGTVNNDALDSWKRVTEVHNMQYRELMRISRKAAVTGDTATANSVKMRADSIHTVYKNRTRTMAAELSEGPLKDFLSTMFPTHYKRRMPDGTVRECELP